MLNKKLKMIWLTVASTTLLLSWFISQSHAADSFNIDSILNDVSNSNTTTWNTQKTSNTTTSNTIKNAQSVKQIEVKKTDKGYDIKKWNKDYLVEFEVNKNTKIDDKTVTIETKNGEKVPYMLEDNLKVYKNWDILKPWKKYYIELGWNYDEVVFNKQDSLEFDRIIKKINWGIDSINWEEVYVFNKPIVEKKQVVKTTKIVKKKTWIEDNLFTLALLLFVFSIWYKLKRKI